MPVFQSEWRREFTTRNSAVPHMEAWAFASVKSPAPDLVASPVRVCLISHNLQGSAHYYPPATEAECLNAIRFFSSGLVERHWKSLLGTKDAFLREVGAHRGDLNICEVWEWYLQRLISVFNFYHYSNDSFFEKAEWLEGKESAANGVS